MRHSIIIILTLFLVIVSDISAEEPGKELQQESIETTHAITIDKEKIAYKAVAGNLILKNDQGKAKASVFYIAYNKIEKDPNPSSRPITFCFNGGPGSSSIWLHVGVLGPKKIILDELGCAVPPYQLIDNQNSLLAVSDLVFIDPISTGYSKIAPGEDPKCLHGFDEDVKWMSEFIRLYIVKANRWSSPKFIAGESYGTTRAVGLIDYLYDQNHIAFNGIILISPVLNFLTIKEGNGNDLPYILSLPSFTAAAWHHEKLSKELQNQSLAQLLQEVEEFAFLEYSNALLHGDNLNEQDSKSVIQQLADYTGLSSEYITKSKMRVDTMRFAKELLRDERRTIGRFDSRVEGMEGDLGYCSIEVDPSLDTIASGFNAALNDYLHRELKYVKEEEYKVLTNLSPWNYGTQAANQYLNVSGKLTDAILRNPHLRVFVGCGYYDLATPYFASNYTFDHLGLDATLKTHIFRHYYEAGHLMYTHEPSLIKLNQDLSTFILSTCPAQETKLKK